MQLQIGAFFFFAGFGRRGLVDVVRLAQERERRAVGAGTRLDDVRNEPLFALVVEVGHVFAGPAPFRSAVGTLFQNERIAFANQLAFGVRAKVEIAAVRDAFELAKFPFRQERERVFDVGGSDRIVRKLRFVVFAHAEPFARKTHVDVPLEASVAPEFIPRFRFGRMAEEFDFHLLEFAAAEREVSRRDFVAEALADLADAERNAHARAVDDVFEVDENALRGFRTQERGVFFAAKRADRRLEHQVEFARLGQRADMFGVRPENFGEIAVFKGVDSQNVAFPREIGGVFFAQAEEFQRGLFERVEFVFGVDGRDEDADLLRGRAVFAVFESGDPAALDMVESIAALRLFAVDHEVVEKVVVPGAFPDLRMHNDRAVEPGHFKRARRAGKLFELVVPDDHVVPPRFFDVSFEQDAQRTVIPESVQTAVNFTRLKQKAAALAKRDKIFHPHFVDSFLIYG